VISHQQPYQPVQQVQINQISMAPQPTKSVGVALVLTFFFGPLGMLYSTVAGGLIMLAANVVLGTLTLGLFFFISWPIQMVWAAVAASNTNKAVAPTVSVHGVAPAPVHPPQPAQWQPPPAPHAGAPAPTPPMSAPPALPQSTGPAPFTTGPAETAELPAATGESPKWYS
jgi:hypothetical protein